MRSEKEIREKLNDYKIAEKLSNDIGATFERDILRHIIRLLKWILEEDYEK
jgi:hypothetical protein